MSLLKVTVFQKSVPAISHSDKWGGSKYACVKSKNHAITTATITKNVKKAKARKKLFLVTVEIFGFLLFLHLGTVLKNSTPENFATT